MTRVWSQDASIGEIYSSWRNPSWQFDCWVLEYLKRNWLDDCSIELMWLRSNSLQLMELLLSYDCCFLWLCVEIRVGVDIEFLLNLRGWQVNKKGPCQSRNSLQSNLKFGPMPSSFILNPVTLPDKFRLQSLTWRWWRAKLGKRIGGLSVLCYFWSKGYQSCLRRMSDLRVPQSELEFRGGIGPELATRLAISKSPQQFQIVSSSIRREKNHPFRSPWICTLPWTASITAQN